MFIKILAIFLLVVNMILMDMNSKESDKEVFLITIIGYFLPTVIVILYTIIRA